MMLNNNLNKHLVENVKEKLKNNPNLHKGYILIRFKKENKKLHISSTLNHYPNIYIKKSVLYFNLTSVDLSNKLKILKIFNIFIENKFLTKRKLINELYHKKYDGLSDNYKNSLNHNIIKLISRARLFAKNNLDKMASYHWFYYIKEKSVWQFIRPKDEEIHDSNNIYF